ncbi:hypothetical protein [Pectobacterium wasabiae]|nr:hypothetical protein [Pectobacterium wasabiae]
MGLGGRRVYGYVKNLLSWVDPLNNFAYYRSTLARP